MESPHRKTPILRVSGIEQPLNDVEQIGSTSTQSGNPRVNFSDVHEQREVGSGLFPVAGDPGGGDQHFLDGGTSGGTSGCGLPIPPGCMGSRRAPYRYHLTYFQRVVGGSGHILNDLCASLWFTYFLLYMQKVAGFTDRNAAFLMLLGQIVDGISTPLVGFEADRANHCWLCRRGYGKCKTWHLVGVILVIISFPFVFSPCIGCETSDQWARAIYYAPFIAIFQIGWASSQISHLALIPKMSSDILMRTELLAIRYGFTVCANITIFLLTWVTLGFSDCEIDQGDAWAFQAIAFTAVCIGGFFSILFHFFVVERCDEDIKKSQLLENAQEIAHNSETGNEDNQHRHHDFVESLNNVTNVRSVASSMAISKVHAQERRRRSRSASQSSKSSADREAGTSLLSDQDDMLDERSNVTVEVIVPINDSDRISSVSTIRSRSVGPLPPPQQQPPPTNSNTANVAQGYSFKALNHGKETVTVVEWLSMPQFYIVAIMYMSTRLNVNITQAYMPLYVQETLKLPCGSVATVPLTMFCSGFVVSIFIKLINKYLGRQLAYGFGALLCLIGALLILLLDWSPGSVMAEKGIYGVAVLLGGGASAILVTSLSITADMIGNNVENGAFVYGAMSFCDKLSCGLAVMLINELKMLYSDVGFYQRVLAYTAGGCSLLGVLGVMGLTFIIYKQNKDSANQL